MSTILIKDRKGQKIGVELDSSVPFPTRLEEHLGCGQCPASGMKGLLLIETQTPKQGHLSDFVGRFRPMVLHIEYGKPGGRIHCDGIAALETRGREDEIPCKKERE